MRFIFCFGHSLVALTEKNNGRFAGRRGQIQKNFRPVELNHPGIGGSANETEWTR
jgi:hypothetical protein